MIYGQKKHMEIINENCLYNTGMGRALKHSSAHLKLFTNLISVFEFT